MNWHFLITCSIISAIFGAARCIHNGDFVSWKHFFSTIVISGGLAFTIVTLWTGSTELAKDIRAQTYYYGLSGAIGLAGKEQILIISITWKSLLKKFINAQVRTEKDDGKNKEDD